VARKARAARPVGAVRPVQPVQPAGAHPTLRRCTVADEPFLLRVYGSTRAAELALAGWPVEQRVAFVRSQYEAQRTHYEREFPAADRSIVLVAGEPVGRLVVDRRPDEVRVVDVSLLPEYRGRGVGTALLEELVAEASGTGRPLRLHVRPDNPARRLYLRLGLRVVGHEGDRELMELTP
jgi:ribosomal protein S18 acetylase RimI-like enzyme